MATQKNKHGDGISWCEETWNPIVGCSVVSPGCTNCYAMRVAGARLDREGGPEHYRGTTMPTKAGFVWTGKIVAAPDKKFLEPLRWSRGRLVFTNSMGDVFHENVPIDMIDKVFAVMALTPRHTYQMLTKRAERQRDYLNDPETPRRIATMMAQLIPLRLDANLPLVKWEAIEDLPSVTDRGISPSHRPVAPAKWPLPNLWVGVSTEDQQRYDERVPLLDQTKAAVRWISYEPAIGPIRTDHNGLYSIDWIVYGEESGTGSRPGNWSWPRNLLAEIRVYDNPKVAFFVKQLRREDGSLIKDMSGFPADLRVRQYPAAAGA